MTYLGPILISPMLNLDSIPCFRTKIWPNIASIDKKNRCFKAEWSYSFGICEINHHSSNANFVLNSPFWVQIGQEKVNKYSIFLSLKLVISKQKSNLYMVKY